MALIIASRIADIGHAQSDGSFWVTERHDLDDKSSLEYRTLYDAGTDPEAVMRERAVALNQAALESAGGS